jgi:hypothetical protein
MNHTTTEMVAAISRVNAWGRASCASLYLILKLSGQSADIWLILVPP